MALPVGTRRAQANERVRAKLAVLRWARDVIVEGERRGLPPDVVEASVFPWTWRTWVSDELARLLSAGDFSRSIFVRFFSDREPSPQFSATRATSRS